jgi:purine-binding chemotaxis protein CheW
MNKNPLTKNDPLKAESPVAHTYCTFQLQGGLFGIDALAVKEISVLPPLTPIPHAPSSVRGYVNLRGQIFLVMDLNRLLQLGETMLGFDTRLIVFRAHLGDPCGILVDSIGDMVELSADRIEQHLSGDLSREKAADLLPQDDLIAGVGKLDTGLLTLLDAGKFLPHIETEIAEYNKKAYH